MITTSARGRNWQASPKGHLVVGALCAPRAKGHAIRSGLCDLSPHIEFELEKAFLKLAHALSDGAQADDDVIDHALTEWRRTTRNIVREHVEQAIEATVPGSPLCRLEAIELAGRATERAMGEFSKDDSPEPRPEEREKGKGRKKKRGGA